MPTLDTLPADQRAIIELLLSRGQSYADLGQMLGMDEARVREYAREALASLSPRTAARVDSEWVGQVADYLLGQQAGPQAKATRGHLKRSEPARTWALSMLDSLGDLYAEGSEPRIPSGAGGAVGAASDANGGADGAERRSRRDAREEQRRVGGAAATGAGAGAVAAGAGTARAEREPSGSATARPADASGAAGGPRSRPVERTTDADARRRRLAAAAIAGVLVLAGVVFLVTQIVGGGEEQPPAGADAGEEVAAEDTAPAAGEQPTPEILSQLPLEPVGDATGRGGAIIIEENAQPVLLVQARLEPVDGRQAGYEVWLYNDQEDAVSLGAAATDEQGNFQGAGALPENFEDYEFIDVSRESRDEAPGHSGNSVLRTPLELGVNVDGEAPPAEGGAAPAPAPEGQAPAPAEPPAP
jgi:hypothetical protein